MSFALAIFVVLGFAVTIERLDLPASAREVGRRSHACLDVLREASLSDDAKEQALQRHARQLFLLLGILGGGSLLAIAWPLFGIWVLEQVGVGSFRSVLTVLQRLDFLAGTTVVGLLGYVLVRHVRQT